MGFGDLNLKVVVVCIILFFCFTGSLYAQKGHYRIDYSTRVAERDNSVGNVDVDYYFSLTFSLYDSNYGKYRYDHEGRLRRFDWDTYHRSDEYNGFFIIPIDGPTLKYHIAFSFNSDIFSFRPTLEYIDIDNPFGCFSTFGGEVIRRSDYWGGDSYTVDCYYNFQIKPIIETIVSKTQDGRANTFLPENDQIYLLAPKDFDASVYNWEYQIGLSSWQSFPTHMKVNGKDSIAFSGNDLIPNFNEFVKSGQNVHFRAKSCSSDTSSTLTLKPQLSSPNITSVTPIPNTCFGEANGSLKIQFDRALLPNELLNITVKDQLASNNIILQEFNIPSLTADYSYSLPASLPPGQFKIEEFSKFEGVAPNYSGGPGHTATTAFTGPTAVEFNASKRDVYCYNGNDGTITVDASGGSGGYKAFYKKQEDAAFTEVEFSAAAQHTITGLAPGSYQLKVADQNGCYKRDGLGNVVISTLTISQPTEPLYIDYREVNNPSSFGVSNGSIAAVVVGGTPNAGNYTVHWTNENGDVLTDYTNTNNPFKTVLNNVAGGRYTLTVTDNNYPLAQAANTSSCIVTESFNVIAPNPLYVDILQTQNLYCNGETTAVLYAKTRGGLEIPGERYNYQWSKKTDNGFTILAQTDSVLTDLGAGIYKVQITDDNHISKESAEFAITEPTALDYTVIKRDVYCYGGQDAAITINATGGNGSYRLSYKRPQDVTYTEIAFATAGQHTLSNLDVGTYTIRVTDQNGCFKKDASGNEIVSRLTITQPAEALRISSRQVSNSLSFGASDGSIAAVVIGGTPNAGNYNVQWTNENGDVLGDYTNTRNPFKTVLNNVPEGRYSLKVTDNNYALAQVTNASSCIVNESFNVIQPSPLYVDLIQTQNLYCNGETTAVLYAKAKGGIQIPVEKYNYQWSKKTDNGFTVLTQTDSTANNLTAGIYKVQITDENNINKESAEFTITEPTALNYNVEKRDVYCYGGQDGTITINATGGNGSYKLLYKKTQDVTYTEIAFGTAGQHTLSNLDVGTYTIRVTDQNGCFKKDASGNEIISTITITQPAEALRIIYKEIINPLSVGASNGSIIVGVAGGTPNAGNYTVQWTDSSGNILTDYTNTRNPFKTVLNNVPEGNYTLKVTDANYALAQVANASSCIVNESFYVKQPDPLNVDIIQNQNVSCNGAANAVLYARAKGGIEIPLEKYSYQWSKKTESGFSILTQTDSVLTDLIAGIYKVQITDKNNISKESALFTITEPTALAYTVEKRDVYCYGGQDGTITINATGGNGLYKLLYKKPKDATYTEIAFATAGQHTLSALDVGTYTIRVTDQNGCCEKDASGNEIVSTITITQPAEALHIADKEVVNPLAAGAKNGSIAAVVVGGTPNAGNYTVQWTDESGNVLTDYTNTSNPFKTVLNNVGDGKYTLKVTDRNYALAQVANASGCILIESFNVKQPNPLKVSLEEVKYISCNGAADGQIYAKGIGGILIPGQKYVYQWFKNVAGVFKVINQADSMANNLNAGLYKVKITDQNNISIESLLFDLTQPAPLKITLSATSVICSGGTATVSITGGTLPYHIEWSTGENTTEIKELSDGNYLVFVTDANGCQVQGQIQVTAASPISISKAVATAPSCFDGNDGTINHTITGGTAPLKYLWSNGATTENLSNLTAGTYSLTISESNGCSKSVTYILSNPLPVKVDLGPDMSLCLDQTHAVDASITDRAIYKWTSNNGFSANTAKVVLSTTGIYYVEVFTDKGCVTRDTIAITKSTSVIASEFLVSTQAFKGESINLINISSPAPQSIEWIIPDDKNISVVSKASDVLQLRFAQTGNYTISLKANVGDCYKLFTKQITVIEGASFNDPGTVKEQFIKSFTIAPNPSSGNFNVKIELHESAKVKLRLLNTITGQLIDSREESGSSVYNLPYNLILSTGMYVMVVETPKENMVYKVLIQ